MVDVERIRSLPQLADVDALIAMSPENFLYVSGAYIITVEALRQRQAFAIIPRHGEPALLVCSIEKETADEESWIKNIHTYTEFVDYPVDALAGVLKAMGIDTGRLGTDLDYLPQRSFARLAACLPDTVFVDTTDVVARMRAIKTEDEVACLEFAARSTHQAVVEAMAESRLGDSEKTMAQRIVQGLLSKGATAPKSLCFGSGERTRLVHAQPTDRIPKRSEIIKFDVLGKYGIWASDLARTYSAGEPTDMQRRTYRHMCEAQEEAIDAVRPGAKAEDIFYACKRSLEKRGTSFTMPHVGHGFGIEIHETPMLRPGDETILQPGMVLNIEPICSDELGVGYHTEDLVVVTETGYRLLTDGLAPKEIPVIGSPLV